MKKISVLLIAIVAIAATLVSFKNPWAGSVRGRVVPTYTAGKAWAVSASDTFKADITQGIFEIMGVKAGTYRIVVQASDEKTAMKDGIVVAEGKSTDAGEFVIPK